MKEKILSIISLVTIFVPLTMLFVWNRKASEKYHTVKQR